ncbi:hypothetical protein J6590_033088 [Homalodisca vitripennis]|nr:hypothetical protein J6590_033088 [Homalodisca vitripennis]
MTLSIEQTKNGKPLLLYNNHKYKESHVLKNGDRAWRCLGGKCGAKVRTNANATQVVTSSGKHLGSHPVTIRTLSLSPTPTRPAASPATLACASTPAASLAQSAVTPASLSKTEPSTRAACVPTRVVAMTPPAVSPATSVGTSTPLGSLDAAQSVPATEAADLVAENQMLKDHLLQLNDKYKRVLDHSIESDTRLMQYTDQVFVANTSRVDSYVRASVADCGVQCDPPHRASAADCGVQCDLPANCRDQWCTETKDLVASLRITIDVLEAEIRCLRGKKMEKCGCDRGQPPEWTVVNHSRKHLPVKTENRYQALAGSQQSKRQLKRSVIPNTPSGEQKKEKTTRRRKPRTPLPFSSILIEGDSHTRDLADLVRRKITRVTKVKGVCKSGGKLLEAVANDSPAPGSCCVIISGTNDVAVGQQYNIYKHLEQRITRKLRTASVVVSTLPHRHDLPATHLIHQETALINNYIEELCERHHGAVVMDFNRIGRGAFTQHGMHLRSGSKHLLAELVVDSLRRMNPSVLRAPSYQPPAASATETPSTGPQKTASAPPLSTHPATLTAAAQPHVLPFDSFAEAVKSGLPNSSPVKSPQKNCPSSSLVQIT